MTATHPSADSRTVDRLRELASIGAGHAAGALGQLVNRAIHMDVPVVYDLVRSHGRCAATLDELGTAIVFEMQGGMGGTVAVVFAPDALEAIVNELMGAAAYSKESAVESALREVGNILVSYHASAIADALGTAVLPSVPLLAEAAGAAALRSLMTSAAGDPPGLAFESALYDPRGEVRGYVVLIPGAEAMGL